MKYSLHINQKALVDNGIDIDLTEAAIFDFIKDFVHSPKCQKIQENGVTYFWISHPLIIENIPLLGISSKRGIINRMDNLIANGLLKRHSNCQKLGRTYYCFGIKYDGVTFCTPYEQKCTGAMNKSADPPMNKSARDYIYNNNNNITDNTSSELGSHPPKDEKNFKKFVDLWFEFFERTGRPSPAFDGAQGKSLKAIIKKLTESSKGGVDPIDSFQYILDKWGMQEEWIQANALDLKVFNQKINVIIDSLRNGGKGKKSFTAFVAESIADDPRYKDF